jgi:hypothetical protein
MAASSFEIGSQEKQFFKVYFSGNDAFPATGLNLTFFSLPNPIQLEQFQTYLVKFNDISRKKSIHSFGNIKEVISTGTRGVGKIHQHYIILYSIKIEDKLLRTGILIGDHSESGFLVLGIWPISAIESAVPSKEGYKALFDQILNSPENFTDILLIS